MPFIDRPHDEAWGGFQQHVQSWSGKTQRVRTVAGQMIEDGQTSPVGARSDRAETKKRSDRFRKMKGNETNLLYDRPGVIPWSFRGIRPPNIG